MTFNGTHIAAMTSAIFLLSGCGHGLDEAMTKQAGRPGVYAQTSSALVEIGRYGTYTLNAFSQQIEFKFDSSIPQVAGPIAFVANVPNALMSDAKVFLLPSLGAGLWYKSLTTASDSKPLSAAIDVVGGSIYKI